MSTTTSVPQIVFEEAGPIAPTEAAILTGTQDDFNEAFGGGLNPALNTPQGQLASSQAAIVSDKDGQILYLCNQFDPQYASGRFQDALARIYFLTRDPAQSTAVICTLGGLSGTVVPAGTLATDTSGNTYVLLGAVTIGIGGTVSSSWQNQVAGPTACPAGTLIGVAQSINGWDTITNPNDGDLGNLVQSRADFEYVRQNSVAINGRGTNPAIYAAVFQIANVLDCYVIDNPAGQAESSNPLPEGNIPNPTNYSMAANSLLVSVVGGNDLAIAQAIWNKKDVGCNYAPAPVGKALVPGQGTVSTQTIVDTSGYSYPQPSYYVSFLRPGPIAVFYTVTILNVPGLPTNYVALVQAAVISQFNGNNGNARARIGSTILAAQYYAPVAAIGQNITLVSVGVGSSANPTGSEFAIGIDQTPTLNASNIAVVLVT
jgi:hypothetical protein